jgi:hypothetical protein
MSRYHPGSLTIITHGGVGRPPRNDRAGGEPRCRRDLSVAPLCRRSAHRARGIAKSTRRDHVAHGRCSCCARPCPRAVRSFFAADHSPDTIFRSEPNCTPGVTRWIRSGGPLPPPRRPAVHVRRALHRIRAQTAVNRLVAGSNPARGAKLDAQANLVLRHHLWPRR